jgi:hypothetical protein
VSKEDLIALCNNEVPKTRERLTARTNDIRHVPVIDKETGQPVIDPETGEVKMRKVSNRRIAVDFTFSVPKSVSMHLALTHDVEAEKLVHEAMRETLDDMENAIQTRVRIAGAHHDRTTGNAVPDPERDPVTSARPRSRPSWRRRSFVLHDSVRPISPEPLLPCFTIADWK